MGLNRKINFTARARQEQKKTSDDKCAMSLWMPARSLDITWASDPSYWKWITLPDNSEEVVELLNVCWLHIIVRVDLKELLLKTSYSAYLVFKLRENSYGMTKAIARVKYVNGVRNPDGDDHSVFIGRTKMPGERGRFPQPRGGGWMEIELGEFYNNLGDDGFVEIGLLETVELYWKSGLIVKGIEVVPNY